MSSSIWYKESIRWDFVRLVQSRMKGELALVHPVRGIKQAGLRPSGTMPCEMRTCPHPSGMRNLSGGTTSVLYEVTRKESFSSSVRYEESSKWDFLCPVRSHAKGKFVGVHPVRGIKWEGLRQSGTKSCEMRACPRPSGT